MYGENGCFLNKGGNKALFSVNVYGTSQMPVVPIQ